MASPAQIDANRANAQRSTGPRTPEGKAKSAANHLSHGLSSREFVILPGQEQEFETFLDGLRASVKPHGALETDLFTQFAHAAWTLRRCRRAEADLHAGSISLRHDPLLVPEFDAYLRAIDLYARRAERTYHRTLKELKSLQTNRQYAFEVELAAYGSGVKSNPAPLSENQPLDAFRRRNAEAVSTRNYTRIQQELEATAAEFSGSAASRLLPELSNPIPAPAALRAAR